ncbi:ubiquitin family protein [Moniliophthora roreri MCA 2997]|uniref:Ubiquitin family protein n=1 Tax=Moniliophthora roreri (strain MCA 2997) TaxID=1381753 RepID=V2YSP4_MONRO|nr:ubiquitin family protein [Moniliophthora roreri MCA 2997]
MQDLFSSVEEHLPRFWSRPFVFKNDELEISKGDLVEVTPGVWDLISGHVTTLHVEDLESDSSGTCSESTFEEESDTDEKLEPVPTEGSSVLIKTLTGKTFYVAATLEDTVETIKLRILAREGIPLEQQRLIITDRQLENDRTLKDYNVQLGSTRIFLILRVVGGKPVIYLFSPREQEARVQLGIGPELRFTALYPVVSIEERRGAPKKQSVTWIVKTNSDGTLTEVKTGLEVPYLFWEAHATDYELTPPSSPQMEQTSDIFVPSRPTLHNANSVVLPIEDIPGYLDKALLALGLHTEARTSFITYWLPSLLKHTNVALRFLPQAAYERAAPLSISPSPDVVTRVFMLFKGVSPQDAACEWHEAVKRAEEDVKMWREIVGIDIDRALDKGLFRVLEWGGMDVGL